MSENTKEKQAKKVKMPKVKLPKLSFSKAKLPKMEFKKDFWLALMAYIPVLILIPLFLGRRNYFVEYHVRQGVALTVIEVLGIFSFYLPVVPYLFALLFVWLFLSGLVNIFARKESPLPVVGKWAENFNI